MSLAHWVAAHRRSLLFLMLVGVAGGAFSAWTLPVALFPQVSFPRIVVSIEAGDRPAAQMVFDVTQPVESAVRSVVGVQEVRSSTSRGSAELSVNFRWGTDMAVAALQVDAAIARIASSLPPGVRFDVRRMDPTVFPIAAYSLTSDTVDQVRLRDIARLELVPLLTSVAGVARVSVTGGDEREYRVEADPVLLESYNLTLDDVVKAVTAANDLKAIGRLQDEHKLFLALGDTRIRTLEDIRRTILRSGEDGVVELEDIARVFESTVPKWLVVTADGRDAVSIAIFQQPDGNTVNIARDVRLKLEEYAAKLPKGVKVSAWYDQSVLIIASAASVRDAVLVGVALAGIVLFVFLRNWKITLIALIVVPSVLASTALLLKVLGMSFNVMTLGGMAAAIGLIIDDAIVMIEQIIRHLRRAAESQHEHIRDATQQFLRPLAGSSASTIIIFLPLAFLGGVTGAFFKALSLTIASALIFSFLVAWFVIPLLADHLLGEGDAESDTADRGTRWVATAYAVILKVALPRPLLAIGFAVVLAVAGVTAYGAVGSGFMPKIDEGGFVLDYVSPSGTSLVDTNYLLMQVEGILRDTQEVATYSRRTGVRLGGGLTEANSGDFFVRLKPLPRRPIETVMSEIRRRVEQQVPGLKVEMAQLMGDLIGDLTAVPQPIEIKIFADTTEVLQDIAPKVADRIKSIKGVIEVRDGIVLAGDAMSIAVDRQRASLEGLDPGSVTALVQTMLSGVVPTYVQRGPKSIGIRVWIPQVSRDRIAAISQLRLRSPNGHMVPLKRIAAITTLAGQPQITRDDLRPMVAVTARIEGRDIGSTVGDIKRELRSSKLLSGSTYYELGGLYQQQQLAFKGLLAVIVAAFALVFLLLLFLYEDVKVALVIIAMPLLAMAAVFIGLWLTRTELNISALMGTTMVIGIVTEVAIFYFSEFRHLIERGVAAGNAVVQAGINRLRPILMTTLAAIFALLPLALNIGQGSAMQQPLAVAIIAGLVVQVPLVLLVMPVFFAHLAGHQTRYT